MNTDYDVVIIGAGPAGATLAAELPATMRVLLVDKRCLTDPSRLYDREKSCGGLLDKRAQKALAALGIALPKEVLADPQVFTLQGIDLDNHAMVRYYQKQYINIDRVRFDAFLVQRAVSHANVDVWDDTVAFAFQQQETEMIVTLRRNGQVCRVTTKCLVGADGATSVVRRYLRGKGRAGKEPKRYASLQEWYPMPTNPACYTAVFDRRVTDFYSWIIPENGRMIIGSALPGDPTAQARFRQYKDDLIAMGFDLSQPIKRRGAVICRPYAWGSVCGGDGSVFLVGEAAGLISPCSCEGISYALNSAWVLGRTLRAGQGQKAYRRGLSGLKRSIFFKSFKSPIMYGSVLRGLVFRSRLLSMKVYERSEQRGSHTAEKA